MVKGDAEEKEVIMFFFLICRMSKKSQEKEKGKAEEGKGRLAVSIHEQQTGVSKDSSRRWLKEAQRKTR